MYIYIYIVYHKYHIYLQICNPQVTGPEKKLVAQSECPSNIILMSIGAKLQEEQKGEDWKKKENDNNKDLGKIVSTLGLGVQNW